ncbi:MAG: hypothetical protein J6562_05515 [Candidatus Schmidhempelia sp.]|nr:hypothetical protein [Candidatus Schmidhempelia sp.]
MQEHNKTFVLLDKDNEQSYTSSVTDDIWLYDMDRKNHRNNFAAPTHKNNVKGYIQAYDYFQDFIKVIRKAEKEIYITGWQINWDAMIAPDLRLVDLLLEVAQKNKNLTISILPWDDTYPVDTNDDETRTVLRNYINEYLGREVISVRLHKTCNDEPSLSPTTLFFSHHQKCVIVDRKIAFVGGVDLAYGRYSHGYDLNPTADNRQVLNRYNPCVALMGDSKKEITLSFNPAKPRHFSIKHNKNYQQQLFAQKYGQPTKETLDDNQPIMPWQDIHVKIEGKAVFDLTLNFVLRWNEADSLNSENPQYQNSSYNCIHRKLPLPTQQEYDTINDSGNMSVQILRSAAKYMRNCEANKAITYNIDLSSRKIAIKKLPPNVQNNITHASKPQSDIYQVMLKLIKRAKRFIYLENQFFISDYGKSSHSSNNELSDVARAMGSFSPHLTKFLSNTGNELPQNQIVKALIDKVANTIFAYQPEPFHIYITLPVHPEGLLNDGSIMATVHQTMQTISFGSDSLLNGIRKHLWVYQQLIKDEIPRNEWSKYRPTYYDKIGDKYKSISLEECNKYVTLLNLRSWAELNNRTVTEQIYVHSKLTIVDDLYVLVGSANINDRSLLGDRDSELAALIVDNDTKTLICPERGIDIPVRQFAYQLRKKNWQTLFGEGLTNAIDMPELASSVTAIQSRARANTEVFESVFPFIPRNYLNKKDENEEIIFASIWPVLNKYKLEKEFQTNWEKRKIIVEDTYYTYEGRSYYEDHSHNEKGEKEKFLKHFYNKELLMPFNPIFWKNYNINQVTELNKIKGYITLLPIYWTAEENNAIPYHIRLIC